MLKVGVTGGIGSGKSMVCKILESLNYPVFYSDVEAKKLSDTNPEIRRNLIDLFGTEVYTGFRLNRPFLASQIFVNEGLREKVNTIIHPRVREAFDVFAASQSSPFVFNEAAILIETGASKNFDEIVLVTAPIQVRVDRVVARDKSSAEEVQARIKKQWTDDRKRPHTNFEIINDGEKPLLVQVEKLIDYLTSSHES